MGGSDVFCWLVSKIHEAPPSEFLKHASSSNHFIHSFIIPGIIFIFQENPKCPSFHLKAEPSQQCSMKLPNYSIVQSGLCDHDSNHRSIMPRQLPNLISAFWSPHTKIETANVVRWSSKDWLGRERTRSLLMVDSDTHSIPIFRNFFLIVTIFDCNIHLHRPWSIHRVNHQQQQIEFSSNRTNTIHSSLSDCFINRCICLLLYPHRCLHQSPHVYHHQMKLMMMMTQLWLKHR